MAQGSADAEAPAAGAARAIEVAPPPSHAHPLHRLSCFLFLIAVMLLSYSIARWCIHALCGRRAPRTANVVMVPPQAKHFMHVKVARPSRAAAAPPRTDLAPLKIADLAVAPVKV